MSSSLAHYHSPISGEVNNMGELLYAAIFEGKLHEVQELLKAGVKTNITNKNNATPLHHAVEMMQYDIVEELLLKEWKTDVDAKNANGDTPLHIAALKGDRNIVQLLLENQAKVDAENNAGQTPIEMTEDPRVISVLEKYCKLSMNETLFTRIVVPADSSCLFWAIALAYLYPMKQKHDIFQQRFEKLFGNVSLEELYQVKALIQGYDPSANDVCVMKNKTIAMLVTEKFRKRVVAEMSSYEKQFEESVTIYDFLYNKQEDYITGGKFQDKFQHEFSQEIINYSINVEKLKPDIFNKDTVEIINSELGKLPDQNQVKELIFKSCLECMSNPTAWGGNHELQTISNILHCSILVFSNCNSHVISHGCCGNDQLYLFNNGEVHYEFGLVRGQVLMEAVKSNKIYKVKMYLNVGVDNVNYQDHAGFTPLDFAVCENPEMIILLLTQGAETGIRDCLGETTDIAISLKNDGVASTLQSYQLTHYTKKQHIKHLLTDVPQTKTSGLVGHQHICSSSQTDGMKFLPVASVLAQDYEVNLIMLFLLQGLSKTKDGKIHNFYLATNVIPAGMFDIIVKYQFNDQRGIKKSKIIFLQAKHKENTKKTITFAQLLSYKNSFSLKQHFESYKEVKQQFLKEDADDPLFSSKFEHTDCDFVIYTNASFAFEESTQNAVRRGIDSNNILHLEGKAESNHYYELIINKDNRKKIMDTMQDSSEYLQLAKELVKSILCNEYPIVNIHCKGIFKKYQFLMKSVIFSEIEQMCTFRDDFLNGDNLSSQAKDFRYAFFVEAEKLTKKTEYELKMELGRKCIKFQGAFRNYPYSEQNESELYWPTAFISELEVEGFFRRLKLLSGQPDANELGEIIKQKIQLVYSVPQNDVDLIYSNVREKVQRWWKEGNVYLTEANMFFQDAIKTSVSFNVRDPVTSFAGRHKELLMLHSLIRTDPQQVVITGLVGIGKTELARYYIYNFRKHYENVIWINATNRMTLTMSFLELSKGKLGISATDENQMAIDIKYVVEEVYTTFSGRKSLFVFDNCGNFEEICEYLPFCSTKFSRKDFYVLMTSLCQEWRNEICNFVLGELTVEEATEFVKQKLNMSPHDASQDKEIKFFIMKLNYFPLAIDQATTYIEYQRITGNYGFHDYLRQYEQNAEALLSFEPYDSTGCVYYNKSFVSTLKSIISGIDHNEQHGQIALKILDTISYFTLKINFSHGIFLRLANDNEEQLKLAVDVLIRHAVLVHQQTRHFMTIHPIIQQLRRIELKTLGLEEKKLKTVLELMMTYLDQHTASHAIAVWSYASTYEELIKEFSTLPNQIMNVLEPSLQFKEALMFGIDSFGILVKLLGPHHPDTLTTSRTVAKLLFAQSYENRREDLKKIRFILDSRSQFAVEKAAYDQINYDKISKIYGEILNLSILRQQLIYQDTRSSPMIRKGVFSSTGVYDNTKTIQEAVDERRQTWGLHHPNTFPDVIKLAEALFQRGNYFDGIKILKELLIVSVDVLGPNHLDTLKIKNGICGMYFALGRETAWSMCIKMLAKYEEIIGNWHPDILRTKILLARILGSRGVFSVALEICQECLVKFVEICGPFHHDVLKTKNLVATMYCKQENFIKAMETYKIVLDEFLPVLGSDNLDILQTKSGIAKVCFKQGNYEKALQTYYEVFNKQSRLLGIEHLHTLFTVSDIHHVLLNSGEQFRLCDILTEYGDIRDMHSFDECSRLLNYWISFSPDNLYLEKCYTKETTMNLPDNFDWGHLSLASMIAKQHILNYLIKHASLKVVDENSTIFVRTLYKAVQEGELNVVKTLIEECIDLSDQHVTLAHVAVQEGHLHILKYFVLKGIDLNVPGENGVTLLQLATYHAQLDIVKYLIKNGAAVNVLNEDGSTLLHWSCSNGHLYTVKCLVENGAEVNALNKDGLTPLHISVSSGCPEVVKYLVDKGADVSVCSKNDLTPLHTAISEGDVNIFRFLINDTVELNAFDVDDLTLLHRACSKGRLNIVKHLVENGAYVNIQNKKGLTPLHLASQEGKITVIKYLINHKADYSVKDSFGATPLHLAAYTGKSEVVKHLIHEGADVNAEMKDGGTVLHKAVISGCLDTVQYLMEKGAYLMKPDVKGNTPLEEAVGKCNNDDVIKFLIKTYAKSLNNILSEESSKNSEDEKNCDVHFVAPVYFAVIKGYVDVVEYLVNEDENYIKYTDKDGHSLLHVAAGKGHLAIINFLLRKGADINYKNTYKETPLYDAINHNYYNIVKYFAENGANLSCVNKRGESPLHRAVVAGCLEIAMFLVDRNVPLDVQDKDGNTPLYYAAKQGNLTLVTYLLEEGAAIHTVNIYGKTALHLCIETEEENFSVTEFLVEMYADTEFAVDDKGWSPLHSAAYFNHNNIIDLLLEKGADVNVRNHNYETALHLASSGSCIDAINALLKRQANVYARNYDDKTFLDVASSNTRKEIESLVDYVDIIKRPWYRNEKLLSFLNEPLAVNEIQSYLDREKIDINACELENETFLHFVCRKGSEELVKLALEKGADIYATTDIAETALHLAARVGNTNILSLLLDKGVSVNFKNDQGETALHEAARTGNEESVKLLFEQDPHVSYAKTAFGNTALHNAVASRDLKIVNFFLNKGFEIDCKNIDGESPLFVAVRAGNEAMVALLLKKNADIKVRDCYGNTCVHVASMKGKQKVLQLLLDVGAEVNLRNFCRETPLHIAYNKEVVELLVKSGADINARTHKLPIHRFAEVGNVEGVKVMLKCSRKDISEQDVDGMQPIHLASREGHIEVIKTLFEEGASLNVKDCSGIRPIHLAAREGHLNVVQYILERTNISDIIDAEDNSGYQPIHLAARGGHKHIVAFILEKKCNLVNSQSICKVVPLHLAARNLHMDVINFFLNQTDCSLDAQDILMQSFLHHVAAGLYTKCKKHVAEVVECVTLLVANLTKSHVRNEGNSGMPGRQSNSVFTCFVGLESLNKLEQISAVMDILDSDVQAKVEQIPCFCNVLRYYKNVNIVTKEMFKWLITISEAESLSGMNSVYSEMQDNIKTTSTKIQETIAQIKKDQCSNQGLEIIFHFLRFLLLTLDTTLIKFRCCLEQAEVTQQIWKKENLLADYATILNDYNYFVAKVLNTTKEAISNLNITDKLSFYLERVKEESEKLNTFEHSDPSNEVFRNRFYEEKIEYYVKKAKLEEKNSQDERMQIIRRFAIQRSLQVIGDEQAMKSLESKLHAESNDALIYLRNNFLSHSTKRSNLFAKVMSEYKPEVFNVECDLDLILKIHTDELKEETKLNSVQTLSDDLTAFSKVDLDLQNIIKSLKICNKDCKSHEQYLLIDENSEKVYTLHDRKMKLKISFKEKFNGLGDASKLIDDFFCSVSLDDSSSWNLYLAVPFFKRRLDVLKNTVLKDSCIEKHLREDFKFTVNQKPVDRIMLCLRRDKQLQTATEYLIFDMRCILTDTLKKSNITFHKKLREKLINIVGYPWLRNYLAHVSHGSALCHELTDLSKVMASDACMLMEKGKLITAFIQLSFKMHQKHDKSSEDDNTKCLFSNILQSSCRVEFLQALKEVGNIKAFRQETEEFIGSFNENEFKTMLIKLKPIAEFLKFLKDCTEDSKTGRLKSKIRLFFQSLNEQEFTDQLLRVFSDKEYLKIVQDIIGQNALTKEVRKYLNIKPDFSTVVIEMVNYRDFFSWLHDLVGKNPEAVKALKIKVKITANVLSKKCYNEKYNSAVRFLREFCEKLESIKSTE